MDKFDFYYTQSFFDGYDIYSTKEAKRDLGFRMINLTQRPATYSATSYSATSYSDTSPYVNFRVEKYIRKGFATYITLEIQ